MNSVNNNVETYRLFVYLIHIVGHGPVARPQKCDKSIWGFTQDNRLGLILILSSFVAPPPFINNSFSRLGTVKSRNETKPSASTEKQFYRQQYEHETFFKIPLGTCQNEIRKIHIPTYVSQIRLP